MIILGYILTAANYGCYCISRFVRQKHMMLFWDILAKILIIGGLFCLGSLSGAYSFFVNLILLFFAYYKETHHYKWVPVYVFFQLVFIGIMIGTFVGISSVLVCMCMTINLIGVWFLPPQKFRVAGAINNLVTLAYQLSIQNWPGLMELVVFVCNVIAYVKYRKLQKDQPNTVSD